MKLYLAGFNLDINTIEELKDFSKQVSENLDPASFSKTDPRSQKNIITNLYKHAKSIIERDNFTPETLSAAYARISRNSKPVNELREIARKEVDRARKSNQNIIFGLGHNSIAEHATFNFDILEVSRYAIETIEHFRLASYTEKSQRYILFKDDFVVPMEIKGTSLEKEFRYIINQQNSTYLKLYKLLLPYVFDKFRTEAKDPKKHKSLEGLAKEDARYIISLATQSQMSMTVNARTLENIIVKCNSHPLSEIREYGKKLYDCTKNYTPSIVKYVNPTSYLIHKSNDLYNFINKNIYKPNKINTEDDVDVKLVNYHPKNADDWLLATILFRFGNMNHKSALNHIKNLSHKEKLSYYKEIFKYIKSWDSVLREFEFIYFTFQLVVSASNYAQLKRHRMTNIISQLYDIDLGITIPESIVETNNEWDFKNIIEKTNDLYNKIKQINPIVAPYILTNAHKRRVLFKINIRELYHFSRLREDQHAQWDIRNTAVKMSAEVKKIMPLAGVLLSGKDQFDITYQKYFQE